MKRLVMPDLDYIKSILDYDPDNGVFTWKVNRGRLAKAGDIAGFLWVNPKRPDNKYYNIKINGKEYRLHRLAYYYFTRLDPAELEIDHINGNSLDNRFNNLRLATGADNTKNYKKPKTNTSGFKGVSWDKKAKKWRARIQVNNKGISLGYFNTAEEASAAYQKAAEHYFKDFKRPQDLE